MCWHAQNTNTVYYSYVTETYTYVVCCLYPNSITLASSELAPNMFGVSSELARSWNLAYQEIQDTKNRHVGTIAQICRAISSELRHLSTSGKNLLNRNTSSTCPDNIVNFGLLTAEICWRVWGTPATFNGFRVLASLFVTARHSSSARQPNFAALNRGRHLYSAGRPSRWALAHILV